MNSQEQCNSLMAYLGKVSDPRQAQGKQYEWQSLMTLICLGILSGQQTSRAIAYWAKEHGQELIGLLKLRKKRIPSQSTVYRALRQMPCEQLEAQVASYSQHLNQADPDQGVVVCADGRRRTGYALDGKAIRGAAQHGQPIHLLSLVRHESAQVLKQSEIASKTNEIGAAPSLLAGLDLQGCVITADALHCQRRFAQQICDQGGDYVLIVKDNQPQLYAAITLLFNDPPKPRWPADFVSVTQHNLGHGRKETRTLIASRALQGYLDWPGACQVLKREVRRVHRQTGAVTTGFTYAITSLSPLHVSPDQLAIFRRAHWTIENKLHYVRDVTFGEDRGTAHTEHTAHALAAIRNAVLNTLRHHDWTTIPDALRHFAASVAKAFALIYKPAS